MNVTKKDPLYEPAGFAVPVPTVSVPPIFTEVYPGGDADVMNGTVGLDEPMCMVIDPPLLPVSVTSGPFIMEISVPGLATISKLAAPYTKPRLANTTPPVDDREPSGRIVTVPPVLPTKKAPNLRPCEGLKLTDIGLGGGCCAYMPVWHSRSRNTTAIQCMKFFPTNISATILIIIYL
jgi:hypothetical protein